MSPRLETTLRRIWAGHRREPLHPLERLFYWLLIPPATLYASLTWARREFYRLGFLRGRRVRGAVVVSIGNLTVGGTGKSPLVIGLARGLQERDIRVAVISRGHGATGRRAGPLLVSDGSGPLVGPDIAGDEPVMIAGALPVVVIVSRNRYVGARLAVERYGAQVVILDDGYQHLGLCRDADIVLLDAFDPFGNGWTLPAGRLREPLSALRDADLFLFVHRGVAGIRPLPDRLKGLLRAFRREAAIMDGALQVRSLRRGGGDDLHGVEWLRDRPVLLVSGVANPQAFEVEISRRGAQVTAHLAYGDHHRYSERDVIRIRRERSAHPPSAVVTTAKDEAKLLAAGLRGNEDEIWIAETAFDPRTIDLLVGAVEGAI